MDLKTLEVVIAVMSRRQKHYDSSGDWFSASIALEMTADIIEMYGYECIKKSFVVSQDATDETAAIIRKMMN